MGWRTAYATTIFLETNREAFLTLETRVLNGSPRRTPCVPLATRRQVHVSNEFFGAMWIIVSIDVRDHSNICF